MNILLAFLPFLSHFPTPSPYFLGLPSNKLLVLSPGLLRGAQTKTEGLPCAASAKPSLKPRHSLCSLLPPALLQLLEASSYYPEAFLIAGLPGPFWTAQSWCPGLPCLPCSQHTRTAHCMSAEWAEWLEVLLTFDLINPHHLPGNLVLPLNWELYTGQIKIHKVVTVSE